MNILVLILASIYFADPNEPNLPIPFINQWCNQNVGNIIYPSTLEVERVNAEWRFEDNKWTRSLADGFLKVYPEAYIGSADVEVNHNGNSKTIRFQGIFKITEHRVAINTCDLTGDNKVDFQDYAYWATRRLMPIIEPNEIDTDDNADPNAIPDNLVGYSLDSSDVVHIYRDCRYIVDKDSETLNLITELIVGKRLCSVCAKREDAE